MMLLGNLMHFRQQKFVLMKGLNRFAAHLDQGQIEHLIYERQSTHMLLQISHLMSNFKEETAESFLKSFSSRIYEPRILYIEQHNTYYKVMLEAKTLESEET